MDHHSDYLDRPCRSLDAYLAQLVWQYEALGQHLSNNPHARPAAHAAHARLADRIRAVEEELAWRVEL